MKIIDEGHIYELSPTGLEKTPENVVQFLKRVDGKVFYEGTTNEEVLEMLLDRMAFLQAQLPCFENSQVINLLGLALDWLNHRTEKRIKQGVETTDKPHV